MSKAILASSGSIEGLTKMVNQFFYSEHWTIITSPDGSYTLYNAKTGKVIDRSIIKKGKRYYFVQ